jgi:hypothetical protein
MKAEIMLNLFRVNEINKHLDDYTQHGNKLNFYLEAGGQEKDFAHPTYKV